MRASKDVLPRVPPHVERGRVYRTERAWHWKMCAIERYSLVHGGGRHDYATCSCSDWYRAPSLLYRYHDWDEHGFDEHVDSEAALKIVQRYLPAIRTKEQLFIATAWQPFKSIGRDGGWASVDYLNFALHVWAAARAAGKQAPWERQKVAHAA
jgi:hypothetical protein